MAAASGALLAALAPPAVAAHCVGDGTDNTCIIDLTNVATETVDAGTGNDTIQFNDVGLALDADVFGSALGDPVRFANFELAQVLNGADLTLTGTTSDTVSSLSWQVDAGGTLRALGGNGIGDGSVVTVDGLLEIGGDSNDETIGSLAGTGAVSLLNAKTLNAGSGTSTFSGVMSGTGNFNKVGTGTLTLTGANTYTGTTTVTAGMLLIGNANAISSSSVVTIGPVGTLNGTVDYNINGNVANNGYLQGNVNITGDVTNNGVIRPGQSPGVINIFGNYAAAGSTSFFDMEIDLDAALAAPVNGTTHDFVNIVGNVTGTDTTRVFFTELDIAADTGLATTGNGIQVIRVTGTGAAGSFVQGNALSAGAYQYLLTYVADYAGTDDGYFLQSAVRDEMVAHPAALSASQAMLRHCFRDDQRIPDSPKGATYGRAWFGYHQGASNLGADTGIDMDVDFSCSTGGLDWRLGYGWFGGVAGGFGSGNVDLVVPSGVGKLDGDARVIELYTAFTSSAFFVNLSAGYADMDWAYSSALLNTDPTSVSGFIAGAQAGVALDLDLVAVKLIGAVNYDDTNCGDSCFGFTVAEDTGLIEAKGTVRFDGVTWGGSIRPWASVSYSDVLSDGVNTVSLDAVTVSSDPNHQLVSLDAGLQAYLDENFALFADGGYHESLSKDINGYKVGAGLKLYW